MMELLNKQALTQEQTKEKDRLFKRLRIQNRKHQDPNSLSLWLQQQIQQTQHEQTKFQQQRKRQGIQQWQEKMRTNQTDRFKWVRNNYQPLPQVTHKQQAQHSESMTIQAIREHWHNTWQPVGKQPSKTGLSSSIETFLSISTLQTDRRKENSCQRIPKLKAHTAQTSGRLRKSKHFHHKFALCSATSQKPGKSMAKFLAG